MEPDLQCDKVAVGGELWAISHQQSRRFDRHEDIGVNSCIRGFGVFKNLCALCLPD